MAMKFRSVFQKENSLKNKADNNSNLYEKDEKEKLNLSTNEENLDPNKWRFNQGEQKDFAKKISKKNQTHLKSVKYHLNFSSL